MGSNYIYDLVGLLFFFFFFKVRRLHLFKVPSRLSQCGAASWPLVWTVPQFIQMTLPLLDWQAISPVCHYDKERCDAHLCVYI